MPANFQTIRNITTTFLAPVWFCAVHAVENIVVIGDSLSKEYAIEFPLLNPDNPAAWGERNWLELLSKHRAEEVDIGKLAFWPDSRLTGHEFNFAFPGSTSSEWEEILTSNFLTGPQWILLRVSLDEYLEDADRVAIFLGGNDLKNNYGDYYRGEDPSGFINTLVSNMETIVEYVRDQNDAVPIVLVNMPDVCITPTVIESKPDPDKRLLVTNLTREVNLRLRQMASDKGIAYADIEQLTAQLTGPDRFVIGGTRFLKSVDPNEGSNDPEYLFSPDGFHPNTTAQFLFANEIGRALNETYPESSPITPFTTQEILALQELEADVTAGAWASAYGLSGFDPQDDSDGDGVPLLQEFAFGMDPRIADADQASVLGEWTGTQLQLSYHLRVQTSLHFTAQPQFASNLVDWTAVPSEQTSSTRDQHRAWVNPHDPQCFLRLHISEP